MYGNCSNSIRAGELSDFSKTARSIGIALFGLGLVGYGAAPAVARPAPDVKAEEPAREQKATLPGKPGMKFGVLGSFAFKTAKHRFQSNWSDVMARVEDERALYARCSEKGEKCSPKMLQWRRMIEDLRGLPKMEQLTKLNRSLNRMVAYSDDSVSFGKKDYWATPAEFFRSRGDCEDYAIVKFLSLLELGFENDQLRVVIVKDKRRQLMHAVTTVNIDDKVYVLDNLNNHAVQHQYVLKYVPLYSANLDDQWTHIVTNKMRAAFITQVMGKTAKAKTTKGTMSATARLSQLLDSR